MRLTPHKGFGVFAKADIPAGTRILSETPLLAEPRGRRGEASFHRHVLQSYSELSAADKKTVMSLHPYAQSYTKHYVPQYLGYASWSAIPWRKRAVLARWSSNYYEGYGISDLACRFNHSCKPNCFWTVHARASRKKGAAKEVWMTYQVTGDVAEGEELTATYVYADGDAREERMEHLRDTWGFECGCEACSEDEEARVGEEKRAEMGELQGVYVEKRKKGYMAKAMEVMEQRVQLYRELELHSLLLLDHISELVEGYGKLKKWGKVRKWAARYMEEAEFCIGLDHPDVKRKVGRFRALQKLEGKASV
jgi:hypothetical protein